MENNDAFQMKGTRDIVCLIDCYLLCTNENSVASSSLLQACTFFPLFLKKKKKKKKKKIFLLPISQTSVAFPL
jgi:hypothetical protein